MRTTCHCETRSDEAISRLPRVAQQIATLAMAAVVLVSSLVFAKPPHRIDSVPAESVLAEAEKAWQNREDPEQTELAIQLWKRALEIKPDQNEISIPLARAYGRVYRHEKSSAKKKELADEGKRYGALAVEKNPKSPQAHAAYAEALGQWAQANKGVGSLKLVKQAVAELEKAISLDSKYAFAHMLLAQFYEQSPRMMSVGDKKKALEQAKLAVEYGGNYAINRVTLAKLYLARDNKAAAKEQLEQAIGLKAPDDAVPETKSDQEEAKKMLKEL